MNKKEYLDEMEKRLSGLPENDIEEHLNFYSEMIDDRIEEGMNEEDAVADTGSLDETVSGILEEYPLSKLVKEKVRPKKKLAAWEIILLILGAPLWIPLLISFIWIIVAFLAIIFSVIVALWAVDACLLAGFGAGVIYTVICIIKGNYIQGVLTVGIALICAGMSVLMFFACKAITKGIFILLKKAVLKIKKLFVGKESKQ